MYHNQVLLSDPNRAQGNELHKFLAENGIKADKACNGKDCQLKGFRNKYDSLVINFSTKNHSSLEVLRYFRLNLKSVRIILLFDSKEDFEILSMTKSEILKLGVSDYFTYPFDYNLFLSAIKGVNRLESWRETTVSAESDGTISVVDESDFKFTKVPIHDFYSGNATIFDLYLRLGSNKYLKILERGDYFEETRIKKYAEEKEVTHLYFKTAERGVYINYINDLLKKMIVKNKESATKQLSLTKSLAENYIEEIYTSGLPPQIVEEGLKISDNIYNLVRRNPQIGRKLDELNELEPTSYTHCFLVSFFSVIICQNIEWATKRTIDIITFGAFLHDIGKLRFPKNMQSVQKPHYNESQLIIYKKHPEFGMEVLSSIDGVKESVKQVVYQHHELVTGEGFPNGLTGFKIYPLAKVVALANAFSNILVNEQLKPVEGLKFLMNDRDEIIRYDPVSVRSLVKGLIKGYKE